MRAHTELLGAALLTILIGGCGTQPGTGVFLADLSDPDPAIRQGAVEAAAALDPADVPRIGALLRSANPGVRKSARDALDRIAQRAARPGSSVQRIAVSQAFLVIVQDQRDLPPAETRAVLRLLSVVANDSETLSSVARLLDDPELGDAALFVLERSTHDSATTELTTRLVSPHPMRAAMARSLGRKGSAAAVPALLHLARPAGGDRNLVVAQAARKALAHIADARATSLLLEAAEQQLPGAERDLLHFLSRSGRVGTLSMSRRTSIYLKLLGSQHAVTRVGAVRGLGSIDLAANLDSLVGALADPAPLVRDAAWSTLAGVRDPAAITRIESLLAESTPVAQGGLLRALCRCAPGRGKAAAMKHARIPSSTVSVVALELLADFDDPALEPIFLDAARSPSNAARAAAETGLLAHAQMRITAREQPAALILLHRTLEISQDDGHIGDALSLLEEIASPASLDSVTRFAGQDKHREQVAALRLAVARGLDETRRELAKSLARTAYDSSHNRSTRRTACDLLERLGEDTSGMAASTGFVSRWHILGPFDKCSEEDLGRHPFPAGTSPLSWKGEVKGRALAWVERTVHPADGIIELTFMDPQDNVSAFALAELSWPRDEEVVLKLGSDDGVAAWVNGTLVHENFAWRGVTIDEDTCRAKFNAGVNRILLKINQGGGGWGFCLRIATRDGEPVNLAPDGVKGARK